MKTVEMDDAAASLSALVDQARAEPIVITLEGKPVAALTALAATTDLENLIVSNDPGFRALVERSRALDPPGTGLSTPEVRRRLKQRRRRNVPPAAPSGKRRTAIARRRRSASR